MTSLSYYDSAIKPYLTHARDFANRAAMEISWLPARPAWETLAQAELDKAEAEALGILETIRSAKAQYEAKPLEVERAA